MSTLWAVCPVYYDVESFLTLRAELSAQWQALDFPAPRTIRFVAIDDSGGQDADIFRLRAFDDTVVVVVPFNLGHQRAIVFGLRALSLDIADDDWVVTLDSDGEDQPSDLPRLLRALAGLPAGSHHVVLAKRIKRHEALWFKLLYAGFKLMFVLLTGTVIRTGNFAAFRGVLTRRVLFHPYFDLSYSSTLLSLNIPAVYVPCERGVRYAGRSKMNVSALLRHGLRMLMPFIDRIAARALVLFTIIFSTGVVASVVVLAVRIFTDRGIPGWASYMLLLILTISVTALGNFLVLFVLFAQSDGLSLRGLHEYTRGFVEGDARKPPAGAGPAGDAPLLASSPVARGVDDAAARRRV
jgi:polyisoprenyl-phosphate glycosyltransferase